MATPPSTSNKVDLVTAANKEDAMTQQAGAGQPVQVQGSDQSQEPTSGAAAKDETFMLDIQQLMLLVHARLCRRNPENCSLQQCESLKNLLAHMVHCQAGGDCTVPRCVSSTQMINHWNHCTGGDCKICGQLKALLPENVLNLTSPVGNPPFPPSPFQ